MTLEAIKSSHKAKALMALGAAATMLVGVLAAPSFALAAELSVDPTELTLEAPAADAEPVTATLTITYDGESAETLSVVSDNDGIASVADPEAGEENTYTVVVTPVTAGDTNIQISSSAEGYTPVTVPVTVNEATAGGNEPTNGVTVEVQFTIEGVTDYSGITVTIETADGEVVAENEAVPEDGLMSFTLEPGNYVLNYTYPEGDEYANLPTSQELVIPEDSTDHVTLDAPGDGGEAPAAQNLLTVIVLGADNAPLAGVEVGVWQGESMDGEPLLKQATDEQGTTVFEGIPDGSYTVALIAAPEGYTMPLGQPAAFGEGNEAEQTLTFALTAVTQDQPLPTPSTGGNTDTGKTTDTNIPAANASSNGSTLAKTAETILAYAGLGVLVAGAVAACGFAVARRRMFK